MFVAAYSHGGHQIVGNEGFTGCKAAEFMMYVNRAAQSYQEHLIRPKKKAAAETYILYTEFMSAKCCGNRLELKRKAYESIKHLNEFYVFELKTLCGRQTVNSVRPYRYEPDIFQKVVTVPLLYKGPMKGFDASQFFGDEM